MKYNRREYSAANPVGIPQTYSVFLLKNTDRLIDGYIHERALLGQPQNQHSYQAGKSSLSALNDLVSRAEDALDCKELALVCFLRH